MSTSFQNPAEFPEGGEGGSGRRPRPVGGGPQEFPVFQRAAASYQALVNEILALTARVQSMELQLTEHRLQAHLRLPRPGTGPHEFPRVSEFLRPGGPQELEMEGGEGGGGGGVFHPPHEINEFPISEISRVLQLISVINERIAALESKVLGAIEKISG
ncbi:MAG TPA: hypothetical protein VGL72_01340 [Bryobacteraceae bacterium]|jgi:hypothetical protein